MKPLYATDDHVKRLSLEDQAIKIEAHHKADTWIPLKRISRIILFGHIQLDSKLLSTCMEKNIPVSFTNNKGEFSGIALGTQTSTRLNTHIQDYFSIGYGRNSLIEWFHAQEQQLIRILKKRHRLKRNENTPNSIQQQLNQRISEQSHYINWPETQTKLTPMLAAHLSEILQNYGYNILQYTSPEQNLDLLQQLQQLISWELWQLAANGHLPKNQQRKHLVRYYQQHQKTIEKRTIHTISKLWKYMNEYYHEQ